MIDGLEMGTKNLQHNVDTLYVGESIDLRKAQEGLKKYNFLNHDHPLIVQLLKDQYAVFTKFGSVSFWNVPNRLRVQFLRELQPYVKTKKETYSYDEDTKVVVGSPTKISFEKVFIPFLGTDQIKIISYVLSQSVALERYEEEIENSLNEVGGIVESMKNSGKIMLHEHEVIKQIGRVLSVKQTTVTHLSLFDKPEEVWESAELGDLYNKLNFEYELKDRFDVLNQKMGYLSDISELLMNFLAEKRNASLEMVIIILIVIEIVLFFPQPFVRLWNLLLQI